MSKGHHCSIPSDTKRWKQLGYVQKEWVKSMVQHTDKMLCSLAIYATGKMGKARNRWP